MGSSTWMGPKWHGHRAAPENISRMAQEGDGGMSTIIAFDHVHANQLVKDLVKDIAIEEPFCTLEDMAAMRLGIEWLTFQYHWLLVVTLRDGGSVQPCLQAARNALSNIQALVSDANNSYNGIAW